MKRIKRYTEQKYLDYQKATTTIQYGTQFIPQQFNTNLLLFIALPYPHNKVQQYHNPQQPGGFLKREREFQGIWRVGRVRGHVAFQTNLQTGTNVFSIIPHNS
ncbi:MAG: hypothetical protein EZS28_027616 [Streblomastix strix]|uniref:Uncharacterized protein n=1 Tax=Streblomastix strix TaxID=222440 RepID=A0A5J4V369_9EUKA|nr:MAG: hypothetical protein EZS28_027616 [Streblomastix strix]